LTGLANPTKRPTFEKSGQVRQAAASCAPTGLFAVLSDERDEIGTLLRLKSLWSMEN